MPEKFIDIGLIITNTFRSIKNDKTYLTPFIMPLILIGIAFFHFWYMLGDLFVIIQNYQYTQDFSYVGFLIDFLNQNILTLILMGVVYGFLLLVLFTIASSSIIKKYSTQRKGEILELRDAISYGIGNLPRILATTIVAGLIIISPILLFFVPIYLGIATGSMVLIGISSLILLIIIIPWIYVALRLSFYLQACVVEDLGPIESIKRSWTVTKGNLLKIFVLSILIVIIGLVVAIPFTIASYAGIMPAQFFGYIATYFVMWPLSSIAFASLYIELTEPPKY